MLLWLALSLHCLERDRPVAMGIFTGLLGASRTAALPFCGVFALTLLWRARQEGRASDRSARQVGKLVASAGLCLSGIGGYLGYIWVTFGNPFILLPKIQQSAWGQHNRAVPLGELLSFKHLGLYAGEALQREGCFLTDIKTTNLIWTVIAIVAVAYGLWRVRPLSVALGFALYVVAVYLKSIGTAHLASNFRYVVIVIPTYLLAYDACNTITRRLGRIAGITAAVLWLAFGLTYFVVCGSHFVQGHWWYY